MGLLKRLAQFGIVIVLAFILQLILIAADCSQTPVRTAEEFARNFFYLDPAMEDQLCAELADEGEAVNDYLYKMNEEASFRGFDKKMIRKKFTSLHIKIESQDDNSAKAHITGETRVSINRVFMIIGKLFHLGEYHPVDLTLDLIKEDGQWRVCGEVAGLNS